MQSDSSLDQTTSSQLPTIRISPFHAAPSERKEDDAEEEERNRLNPLVNPLRRPSTSKRTQGNNTAAGGGGGKRSHASSISKGAPPISVFCPTANLSQPPPHAMMSLGAMSGGGSSSTDLQALYLSAGGEGDHSSGYASPTSANIYAGGGMMMNASSPLSGSVPGVPKLSVYKQRDVVQRARQLLETPLEALRVLEQLHGIVPGMGVSRSPTRPSTPTSAVSSSSVSGSAIAEGEREEAKNTFSEKVLSPRGHGRGGEAYLSSPTTAEEGTFRIDDKKDEGLAKSESGHPRTTMPPREATSSSALLSRAVSGIGDPSVAAQALYIRGLCLGNTFRTEDAYMMGDDLIRRFPRRSEGYYLKGLALSAMDFDDEGEIERAFAEGLQIDAVQFGEERVAEMKRNVEASLQAQRLHRFKLGVLKHQAKYHCFESPHCPRCDTLFANPTLGWYCPHCMRDEHQTGKREIVRVWQPDAEGSAESGGCRCCRKKLGAKSSFASLLFSKLPHHCRCCGYLVCGSCSTKKSTVDILLIREPERVCDFCYKKRYEASQRSRSPIPLRPFTEDELGVSMGCAPAPVVGRVGVDLAGMVAEYASPVVVKQSSSDTSFVTIDHKNNNNSGSVGGGGEVAAAGGVRNASFGSRSDRSNTSAASSTSSGKRRTMGGHRRASNVHTCIKSSFEQQLWNVGMGSGNADRGGGIKNKRSGANSNNDREGGGLASASSSANDVSTINLSQAAAIEEAQGEAEILLARFLLPFQDAYGDD